MALSAESVLKDAGFWPREKVREMDHIATARMLAVHPEHASPFLRQALHGFFAEKQKKAKQAHLKRLTPEAALQELFDNFISDDEDEKDISEVQLRMMWRETADVLKRAIAAKHGYSVTDLESRCRSRKLSIARHEAMYLIARDTAFSYPRIGRMFHIDHTSAIHGVRKHAERNNLPFVRRSNGTAPSAASPTH